jgi:hypothetical protein
VAMSCREGPLLVCRGVRLYLPNAPRAMWRCAESPLLSYARHFYSGEISRSAAASRGCAWMTACEGGKCVLDEYCSGV